MGRPEKYKPEYCDDIINFFSVEPTKIIDGKVVPNRLPTMGLYAMSIGVCYDSLREWCQRHPEFKVAHDKALALQESLLISNGLVGNYNPAVAIFCLKNIHNWSDKQHIRGDVTLADIVRRVSTDDDNGNQSNNTDLE